MSAFKRINKSDVFVLPYVANKNWQFSSSSLNENGIVVYSGVKDDNVFDPINDTTSSGYFQKLIYKSLNHLYYQEFSGSYIDDTRLLQTNNYISSSIYHASSSYYNYKADTESDIYFPTGTTSVIKVISIPKKIYGNSIKRGSFSLKSDLFNIVDDSKGNILDTSTYPYSPVGNIFYTHGLIVITQPSYQSVFGDYVLTGDFSDDFYDDFF